MSKSFSIQGKGLKLDLRADIEPHLTDLRAIQGLQEIHFGGNTIGVEAAEALADTLRTIDTLKVADFADIFTGRLITEIPQSLSAICNALADKATLVEVNLSDNAFGGRSAEPMVHMLSHNTAIQVLRLNNNGLGIEGGNIVAGALLASAQRSLARGTPTRLRTIVCGRNRLENGSATAWADAYAAHGASLEEVRMFQNGIRKEGVATLARGLSKCGSLRILDLQDNTCQTKGSRDIAAALPCWTELRTLNLSDCLLGSHGGLALAVALGKGSCPKLETLQLQFDELNPGTIDALASAISGHMPQLAKVELNGNRADPEDECITNIRDALASHGHDDALDELDEMEEYVEGESSEEEQEEEQEEAAKKPEPTPTKTITETVAQETTKLIDSLTNMMSNVSISK